MRKVAGIDVGIYGAIVVVDERRRVIACSDFPIHETDNKIDPALRFDVNALRRVLSQKHFKHETTFIEQPTLYGRLGKYTFATLIFSYAMFFGLLKTDMRAITAKTWKDALILDTVKNFNRIELKKRWPKEYDIKKLWALETFAHVADAFRDRSYLRTVCETEDPRRRSGRAEAYLLACYGLSVLEKERQ